MNRLAVAVESESECQKLARDFAPCLDAGHVLLVSGPLGAGKSVFCRELIQSRQRLDGVRVEDVPSPTFTLVQAYETPTCSLLHADLYRVERVSELEELGLDDAIESSICLVEWPEIIANRHARTSLFVDFEITGEFERDMTLRWYHSSWGAIIDRVFENGCNHKIRERACG